MVRFAGIASLVAAVVMIVAGAFTWYTVHAQLVDEQITVSEDAPFNGGQLVDGPLDAYAQTEAIEKHVLEATGGKTYAELDRDDPVRETAQAGSFLRASLFTSVVAFGVAALVVGLGVLSAIVGLAFLVLARRTRTRALARGDAVATDGQVRSEPVGVPSA